MLNTLCPSWNAEIYDQHCSRRLSSITEPVAEDQRTAMRYESEGDVVDGRGFTLRTSNGVEDEEKWLLSTSRPTTVKESALTPCARQGYVAIIFSVWSYRSFPLALPVIKKWSFTSIQRRIPLPRY